MNGCESGTNQKTAECKLSDAGITKNLADLNNKFTRKFAKSRLFGESLTLFNEKNGLSIPTRSLRLVGNGGSVTTWTSEIHPKTGRVVLGKEVANHDGAFKMQKVILDTFEQKILYLVAEGNNMTVMSKASDNTLFEVNAFKALINEMP